MCDGDGATFGYLFAEQGMTEPLEPKTLPKRVVMKRVYVSVLSWRNLLASDWVYISAIRLMRP